MADSGRQAKPISLFYSYSDDDEEFRMQLEKSLATLHRKGLIAECYNRRIDSGKDWAREIDHSIMSADIILLLVSESFINSDYCWGVELEKALERHIRGEAKVVPIILQPCWWDATPFAKLEAAPTDAKPVASWPDQN